MANGILGKNMTVAGTNLAIYTVPPTAAFATISISMVNKGPSDADIKLAIGTSATPDPADYIEFGAVIPANGGGLERTCIVVSPGEIISVESTTANVAVRVYGLEKLA